jgi:hypothetical protein
MFDHCSRVYAAMFDAATPEEIGEITDAARAQGKTLDTRMVWEGHLTRVFNQLELSTPYYTSVMNHLKRMGCVEQLRRGGGTQTSKWQLHYEPTLELYEARGSGPVNPTTLKGRVEELERLARDRDRKLNAIMAHLGVKL